MVNLYRLQYTVEENAQMREFEVLNPAWETIEERIRALDGSKHTEIVLRARLDDQESSLGLDGGNGGRIVVSYQSDFQESQTYYFLIDNQQPNELFEQVIGGQATELPGARSVSLEKTLSAARYFHNTGMMAPDLEWELE